jgi:hypothetical protein
MKINHQKFKKRVKKAGTKLSEVSLLLPDEYFKCKIKRKVPIKKIMFVGLNRAKPKEYNLSYNNIRGKIFFLLKDKKLKERLKGAYLTDFLKWEVLKKLDEFKDGELVKSKYVVKNIKKYPEKIAECGKILEDEIKQFEIKNVFCWGWESYRFIKKYLEKKYNQKKKFKEKKLTNSEMFSCNKINNGVDFVYIIHYGGNARENHKDKTNQEVTIEIIKRKLENS